MADRQPQDARSCSRRSNRTISAGRAAASIAACLTGRDVRRGRPRRGEYALELDGRCHPVGAWVAPFAGCIANAVEIVPAIELIMLVPQICCPEGQ